jgi:hypothetical protein
MWQHYFSNSIVIANIMWTFVADCRFENILPSYFCVEVTQQNFHIVPRKVIKYMSQFLLEAVPYIIALILTWGVHIQKHNIAAATS